MRRNHLSMLESGVPSVTPDHRPGPSAALRQRLAWLLLATGFVFPARALDVCPADDRFLCPDRGSDTFGRPDPDAFDLPDREEYLRASLGGYPSRVADPALRARAWLGALRCFSRLDDGRARPGPRGGST